MTSQTQDRYATAMTKLRNGGKGLTYVEGGTPVETRVGEAYQAMVAAGEAPQIRRKYRVGQRFKKVRG